MDDTVQLPVVTPPPPARQRWRIVLAALAALGLVGLGLGIGALAWRRPQPRVQTVAAAPSDSTTPSPSTAPSTVPSPSDTAPSPSDTSPPDTSDTATAPPDAGAGTDSPTDAPAVLAHVTSDGDAPGTSETVGPFDAPTRWTVTYTWDCSDVGPQRGITLAVAPTGGSYLNIELDDQGETTLPLVTEAGPHQITVSSVCPYDITVTAGHPD